MLDLKCISRDVGANDILCYVLQPQLPQNREIVHLTIPEPNLNGLGTAGTALGRRLRDAAGEVHS